MFESMTYESLMDEALANAPEGIDLRQGSIFYDAISAIIMSFSRHLCEADLAIQSVFITTATGEYLDMRAAEYGLERLMATPAKYLLVYDGTTPDMGSRFFHDSSGKYFTVQATTDGTLVLVAEEAGTLCNSCEGDNAVPVNSINGLNSASFGSVYAYGTNDEEDDDLRIRIQDKISGPAENGNRQHYKTWCESVNGVGLARIYPLWAGPNTVKAVLITPLGLPCSAETVREVQKYIDPADKEMTIEIEGKTYTLGDGVGEGVANVGAHFTAVAASERGISVSFKAELQHGFTVDDAKREAKVAIAAYLKDLVLDTAVASDVVVRWSGIGAIISGLKSVLDYTNLTINGGTSNIAPMDEEVPVLKEVTVSAN